MPINCGRVGEKVLARISGNYRVLPVLEAKVAIPVPAVNDQGPGAHVQGSFQKTDRNEARIHYPQSFLRIKTTESSA